MNDNPSPFSIHPDEQLEARLTAWVLGEASPFEIAELESLVAKSPELQLFLNRTRAIHSLLQEAETTANEPNEDWKLPPGKRFKIARAFGENPEIPILVPEKESRIRRASFRAAWGIAAVFVVTFFSLRLLPRDYEAEAVIEIKPRERTIDPNGSVMRPTPAMTAQFFGTEFEKIKSRNSLSKVIDNLDLTSKWNTDRETALKILKDSVETENIRGTDLIAIRARHPNEEDARDIAAEVTRAYKEYRTDLENKSQVMGINEIRKAVRLQEDKVEERRKVLTTISRTKDIIYYGDPEMSRGGGFEEDSEATHALDTWVQLEDERMNLESQVQNLLKYDSEALLIYAAGLDLPDNTIKSLYPQYLEQMRQIEGLKAGGLDNRHPTILSNLRIMESTKEQLDEGVVNLRSRLQGNLELLKERLEKVEVRNRQTKKDALERSIDTSDYVDAKKDFETDLALLEQMKLKLMTEEIVADLPNETIIVHDDPVITGKRISNPLAALKKAFTPEAKSSAPAVAAKMAAAEPSKEKIEIAGNTRTEDKVIRREAPAEPTGDMEKVIAAKTASPVVIPVPDVGVAEPSMDFGDGDDFGSGFASNGNRSGDRAITRDSIDEVLNNPERASTARKPPAPAASAPAPASEMSSLAQREIVRRQESLTEADGKLMGGRDAYAKGDYGQAVEKYKEALQQLPESPATADRRESYTQHLNDASLARASELRKVGKYDEARELLKQAETNAPADARIKQELEYLEDPIRTSPALTYEHNKQIEEVRRNLYMAQGNYDLGKFDDAKKIYEDTLRIDPYNKAARKGMEKIQAAQSDYYRAAYDHTRTGFLAEVDKAWELEVPAEERTADLSPPPEAKPQEGADQDARAELLAEVDRAWKLSVPADAEGKKKGQANEQVDLFADPAAPGEIGSLTGLFSEGIATDSKQGADSNNRFNMNLRAGAERSDDYFYSDFDGFANYGAPIAGEPTGEKITNKFTEITQANDKELGFDWILPLDEKADPFWDTSDAVAKAEGKGGVEYEINTGYKSDYLFRGVDLSKNLTGFTGDADPDSLSLNAELKEGEAGNDIATIIEENTRLLKEIPNAGKLLKQQLIDLADLSQEIPAAQEPFSTFSLNISDASFQLAAAAVEKGERPDPASIKPEQFYNAVDYGDPAPSSLEPVAAAIDQTAHPVIPGRNLVRVAIRTASTGRSAAQPLRLTLLVDQSGSMARADRRAAMNAALAQLATLLTENDQVTVIGFSRTPRLIADALPGNEAAKLPDLINPTASEGGTNLEQALNLSSELALRHKLDGAQNRIVLFTDGAANLGDADPGRLAERVKELRQQGLAFDIAGIGTNDTNDRLLSELARHGNGRYYLVGENTGASLAAQLAGAFRPAAENVKVQVKLNPERVGNYKLIGFEKDRLKTEDFHDDSVDAAELAADEAGVAIYQVETLPEGSGEIGEVSVRFRDTASGEMVERAWTIPHGPTTPAFDKAAPQTQLATLALLAAQKLQGGPLADAIRFGDHTETIAKLKQTYANDEKAQRLLTLINALR
jgi:Mg-chelatase subunit ChlD/tetratricopeptide (TPR) repeat protein